MLHKLIIKFIRWYLKNQLSYLRMTQTNFVTEFAQLDYMYKNHHYWEGAYTGVTYALEILELQDIPNYDPV